MGKYLSAELYKALHRKSCALGMPALILAGELLLLFLLKTAGFSNVFTYESVLRVLMGLLNMGFYLALIVGDLIFSDQYKQNTLKNEVAYGISRMRIYFGKLLAAVFTATALCAVTVGAYLLLGALAFPVGEAGATTARFKDLGMALAVAFPVWLGALGFAMMLLFTLKGSIAASMLFVLALYMGGILELARVFLPRIGHICALVQRCLLSAPMQGVSGGVFDIPYAWAVGTAWFALSAVIGAICFQNREIG